MSLRAPSYVSPTVGSAQMPSLMALARAPASMIASRTTPTLWVFVIPIGAAEHPRLADPLQAGELAVAVEPMRSGEHRLRPRVAGVGDDDGDAGADRTLARPQRARLPR